VLIHPFHRWDVTPRQAVRIQEELRARVVPRGQVRVPRLIAGADAAFTGGARIHVAIVVLTYPALELVESVTVCEELRFPYVPGLLSFREAPALLTAFGRLRSEPDIIFIDGHGISHPRRAGIACHIGVLLDRPVIGCAKSVLVGSYRDPDTTHGAYGDLLDKQGDVIGAVVRTRDRVRPVFVSVGHRIGLRRAIQFTLACTNGFRLPEPTRQADHLAERAKREAEGKIV
jgi:deoxyribonuclease V